MTQIPRFRRHRAFTGRRSYVGRPLLLLLALPFGWSIVDPALIDPPGFLSATPEIVSERFTRCGPGRGHGCVVDGDTFKLGKRRIRIVGIDAPEVHGQCAGEIALAERSTAYLTELLNQGAFRMTARIGDVKDRYGRDLRTIERRRPDGSVQSIAKDMRARALAHRYTGFKWGWC